MRTGGGDHLRKAKGGKNDEFYTQRKDIDAELGFYQEKFRGKTVYCNCDDPKISHFVSFFRDNFHKLGLKELVATGYANNGKRNGTFAVFDSNGEIQNGELVGDGDFRSRECLELLERADIVVTNPPFSLFRDFVSLMFAHQKDFLVIANVNAITYKEVFPRIQRNEMWLGVHLGRGVSGFIVPAHYDLYGTEARIDEAGNRIVSTNNALWLTTLDHDNRHEPLPLAKTYFGNEAFYPKYDNLDGINVNKTKDIPSDYFGLMGVPITFLHKYNPEQFRIVRFRKGDDGRDLSINGRCPYFRIIIQRAEAEYVPQNTLW